MDVFRGRGTPGIGDAMMYMNVAHLYAYKNKTNVELEIYWNHSEDFLYHFEDPETIIERVDYLHQFYLHKDLVNITHKFNIIDNNLEKYRMTLNGKSCIQYKTPEGKILKGLNSTWAFDPKFKLPTIKNKVVVWRTLFNAETPRRWKLLQGDSHIKLLRGNRFNVIELDYRTPIREVMWHINTCEFVVCYDGMWHYVARNFFKPMMVQSHNTITRTNTPHAIRADDVHTLDDYIETLDVKQWQHEFKGRVHHHEFFKKMGSNLTFKEYMILVSVWFQKRFFKGLHVENR